MISGSASGYLDLSAKLIAAATGNSLATVSVAGGGTGYSVGDILTLAGGTSSVAATVEVTTVSGGVITGVRALNAGVYTVNPSSPNSATGGGGTSASLTVTFASNGWTQLRDQVWTGSDREVILMGEGDGADEIYVGWRTFTNSSTYWNWELHGMTGYTAGLGMVDQPGVSPGFSDGATAAARTGAYLLLFTSSIDYWFHITPYRILIIAKVDTRYFNAYLGWGDRFATESEYPYPMVIAGHTNLYNGTYSQSTITSGLVDPCVTTSTDLNGPMEVRGVDGQWYNVHNFSATSTGTGNRVVIPCGVPAGRAAAEAADIFISSEAAFIDVFPNNGSTSTANANMLAIPGASATAQLMLPASVVFSSPSVQVLLSLHGVFWTSGVGGVTNQDRIIVAGEAYRVFQNCNRTNVFAFLAVKE